MYVIVRISRPSSTSSPHNDVRGNPRGARREKTALPSAARNRSEVFSPPKKNNGGAGAPPLCVVRLVRGVLTDSIVDKLNKASYLKPPPETCEQPCDSRVPLQYGIHGGRFPMRACGRWSRPRVSRELAVCSPSLDELLRGPCHGYPFSPVTRPRSALLSPSRARCGMTLPHFEVSVGHPAGRELPVVECLGNSEFGIRNYRRGETVSQF